jgi:hypothetical protein
VGRILREYGEESNWRSLQNKIVKARLHGGLHTTGEVADLIRNATPGTRGSFLTLLPLWFSFDFAFYIPSKFMVPLLDTLKTSNVPTVHLAPYLYP